RQVGRRRPHSPSRALGSRPAAAHLPRSPSALPPLTRTAPPCRSRAPTSTAPSRSGRRTRRTSPQRNRGGRVTPPRFYNPRQCRQRRLSKLIEWRVCRQRRVSAAALGDLGRNPFDERLDSLLRPVVGAVAHGYDARLDIPRPRHDDVWHLLQLGVPDLAVDLLRPGVELDTKPGTAQRLDHALRVVML